MMLDPVIAWSSCIASSLLFAAAAVHKLSDLGRFEAVVKAYELVPSTLARPLARLLAVIELAIVAGLLVPGLRRPAVIGACLLLVAYTTAISVSLARGKRDIDCGCFAASARVPVSEMLVVRNAGLMAVLLALVLPVDTRELVWVDAITVGAAVVTLALLWASAQRLAITAPALRRLGGAR